MDGLSAASTVITLFELAREILDFRRRFVEAPAELERLLLRIESLALESRILLQSKRSLNGDEFDTPESHILFGQCIESIRTTIRRIRDAAAKTVDKFGWKSQMKWAAFGKSKMEILMSELHQTESSLSLVLQLLQWKQLRLTNEGLQQIGMNVVALILEFKRFKRPCDCCEKQGIRDTVEQTFQEASVSDTRRVSLMRATTSRTLKHYMLNCNCGLHGSMVITGTARDRCYVSSVHLKILPWLVLSVDLMIRLRPWISLTLDGSRFSMRHFVREDSEFMKASHRGDVVTMKRLLSGREATPFEVTDGNVTPLALAIESGAVEAVALLLNEGVDVNDVFGLKQTSPLAWALKQRKLDVARLLVERGASFHHLSIWGWSPLFYLWSRTTRHPSSTEYLQLLRSKHDFSWLHQSLMDVEGWGLMHRAAIFGTPEDVLMLIRFGVDPFQMIGSLGWMVLHNVVYYGVVDVFLELLPYYEHLGTELPDHRGWTLLHIAAAEGRKEIMYHLLMRGADTNALTKATWVEVPESMQGRSCSVAELAEAHGKENYSVFVDVLEEVSGKDSWYDAQEHIGGL